MRCDACNERPADHASEGCCRRCYKELVDNMLHNKVHREDVKDYAHKETEYEPDNGYCSISDIDELMSA